MKPDEEEDYAKREQEEVEEDGEGAQREQEEVAALNEKK